MNDADKGSPVFYFFYDTNPEEAGLGSCGAPGVLEARAGRKGEDAGEAGEESRRDGSECLARPWPHPHTRACNYCLPFHEQKMFCLEKPL